jgi:hypothetical protein
MRLLVLALCALVGTGCYDTPRPACQFLCGAAGECPDGYGCGDDNRCHRMEPSGELAACEDRLPIDAARFDARELDAGPDAEVPDSAPKVCPPALVPIDDGSGAARQALVLSELDPGDHVEVYNGSAAAIDLDAVEYRLVTGDTAVAIASADVGAGITVPAGGYAELGWPAAFAAPVDGGGEVVLYLDDTLDAVGIMDFVCWGKAPATSRKGDAETAGKWTADEPCPAVLSQGAIHRLVGTDGRDAADYDVDSAPSPSTCVPQ